MLEVSAAQWRNIFPKAPSGVIEAFANDKTSLVEAGVLETRQRLAYFCANVEHECDGFTIPLLTENINYSASRMAAVWPNRFKGASDVVRRYGNAPGWQLKAFDDIYGGRMGNRPGTSDGSRFIGRGGPQITGRDGYEEIGARIGAALALNPSSASDFHLQPAICGAFWSWKRMNAFADRGDFTGCVRSWNGGTNGMADRLARMSGNDPIIARLSIARSTAETVNEIAGNEPKMEPPLAGDVAGLQRALNVLGTFPELHADGIYGSMTKAAVKDFQRKRGLIVDGIAGPKTLAALATALAA